MERFKSQRFMDEGSLEKESEESEKTESMNSIEKILMHHFPVEKLTEKSEEYWEDYTSYNVKTPSEATSLLTPMNKKQGSQLGSQLGVTMGTRIFTSPVSGLGQSDSVVSLNYKIHKLENIIKFEKSKNKKLQQRLARIYSKFEEEK